MFKNALILLMFLQSSNLNTYSILKTKQKHLSINKVRQAARTIGTNLEIRVKMLRWTSTIVPVLWRKQSNLKSKEERANQEVKNLHLYNLQKYSRS